MLPQRTEQIDGSVCDRIAKYLCTIYNIRKTEALKFVPQVCKQWGKVRRINGGDTMHARDQVSIGTDNRDASFVKVSIIIYLSLRLCNRLHTVGFIFVVPAPN